MSENIGIPPIEINLNDYIGREITFGEVGKRIQKLGDKAVGRMMDLLALAAANIRDDMIQGMKNTPKTGRKYYRSGTGKNKEYHIASSPYNFPAVDSGNLVKSIIMDRRFTEVEVGSIITYPSYPIWLEYGTGRIKKRPWIEPVYKEQKPKIKKAARRLLDEIIAGV